MQTLSESTLLDCVKTDTSALIDTYFESKLTAAAKLDADYLKLWQTMATLAKAGGKRLRPYMTVLAYYAFGGKSYELIRPVAVAQELLHLCLLVHDDIIDRDFVRYGIDNVSGTYLNEYEKLIPDPSTRIHFANSAAILAGDLLLAGAYELIATSKLDDTLKLKAQSRLSESIFNVAGGELLDTESVLHHFSQVDALKIAKYKTSSYSFVGPLCTGAELAEASQEQITLLAEFGTALGIAFQMTDDILGVFGDSDITGKSNLGDLSEGKRTYMMQKAFELCTETEKTTLATLVGKPNLQENEAEQIREILITSGAKEVTETLLATYAEDARKCLDALHINSRYADELAALIEVSTIRDK